MAKRPRDTTADQRVSDRLHGSFFEALPGLARPQDVERSSFIVGYKPNERLMISQVADKYRMLSGVGAAEPGPWKTSRTPYLREIMDNMSAGSSVWKQSFVSGAQTGKSEAGNNMLFAWMSTAPGPIMMVLPSAGVAKKVSKQRLTPMIQASPFLRAKVTEDLQLQKEFHGGLLFLASAESGADLRSLPIRYLYCDETDAYILDVNGEGPPVGLAMRRTNTFKSKRKVYLTSTPTKESTSVIWHEWLRGDMRLYHMPCPHCEEKIVFEFEGLKWDWDDPANTIRYECTACGEGIEEYHKTEMLEKGEWIPTRVDLDKVEEGVRSYRLNSLYSPLGWLSWLDIARTWMDYYQSPMKVAEFRNTILGLPTMEQNEKVDWERVWYAGDVGEMPYVMQPNGETVVPKGVLFLTGGVDIGRDHIEVGIWGFGRDRKRWLIDHYRIDGLTTLNEAWEHLTDHVRHAYRNHEGVYMPVKKFLVDTSYIPEKVKPWIKRMNSSQVVGVDPMDGLSTGQLFKMDKQMVNTPTGKKTKVGADTIVYLDVSWLKGELVGNLQIPRPDIETDAPSDWVHFPIREGAFTKELAKQITSERKTVHRDKNGAITKETWDRIEGRRAEALDCHNYARGAAAVLGWDNFKPFHFEKLEVQLEAAAQEVREALEAAAQKRPVQDKPLPKNVTVRPSSTPPVREASEPPARKEQSARPAGPTVVVGVSPTHRRVIPKPKRTGGIDD